MGKHTQGPWSRDKYGSMIDAMGESVILRGTTTLCSGSDDRMAMAEANTDLACAAPELLEALEAVLNAGRGTSGRIILDAEDEALARAAIARARGEA